MAFHHRKLLNESDPESSCQNFCDPNENLDGFCPPRCMNQCPGCCRILISDTPTPPLPDDYFVPDIGQPHKPSTLSHVLIVFLAILASSFFFFACYIIYKIFLTWYNSRRTRSARIDNEESGPEEFLDVDHGPVVDHPIWYIRTVGLDPSVISSIAIVKYEKGGGLIEGTDCSVCLSEFQENESLRLLPKCNHAFHIPCIDTWLRAHTNCPMCRARIVSSTRPVSSSENLIVPNSGRVEETNEAGASGAESEDSDLIVRIEEEDEPRAPVGLKMNEIYGVENGIQPTRRSVSVDYLSASVIRKAIANASSAQSDETPGLESAEMKETNGGIVEKSAGINRNLLCLVGSSSSSRPSRMLGSSSMKRSVSCSVLKHTWLQQEIHYHRTNSRLGSHFFTGKESYPGDRAGICHGVVVVLCMDQGLRFLSGNSMAHVGTKSAPMGKHQSATRVQSSFPAPRKNGFSNWMKWTLGSLLSLLLPLLGKTWNNVRRLEGKVEVVAEEVDAVAEVVESVPTAADKALKEVAEELPDDSKFKEAAVVMEHLCCVAAQDSKLVQNLIHKAGEVKQDLEDMDTMVQAAVGNVQLPEETKKPT